MRRLGRAALFGCLLAVALATGEGPRRERCALPRAAATLIGKDFRGWRPVTIEDLVPEDRAEWDRLNGNRCPGLALGEFGPGGVGLAASLINHPGARGRLAALVLIDHPFTGRAKLEVLSPPSRAGQILVVATGPPGKYPDSERTTSITSRFQVIIYGVMDAGAVAYYWTLHGFRWITISE